MDVRVYSFANLYHLHVSNSFKALESPFSLKVVESQRDLSITGAKTEYGMTSCITGANKNNLEFQITTWTEFEGEMLPADPTLFAKHDLSLKLEVQYSVSFSFSFFFFLKLGAHFNSWIMHMSREQWLWNLFDLTTAVLPDVVEHWGCRLVIL